MKITKILTKDNLKKANRTKKNIRYIVIHYLGGLASAENTAKYWASGYVGSSAHFIVSFDGSIFQSVEEKDIAWHCGAKKYVHPKCRNTNSIGIEMCVRKKDKNHLVASDKDWYFEDETVKATIELTKELMEKYDIPVENVIRHYDVTSKTCPAPYVHNPKLWDEFKDKLVDKDKKEVKVSKPKVTTKVKEAVKKVVNKSTKKTGYVKVLSETLNVRKNPTWDEDDVCGVVTKGEIFTVNKKIDGGFYLLKSGMYITSSEKYVSFFEK